MAGEMVIRAEAPPLRTAGMLGVVVDGERVGEVKQGGSARFPLGPGQHTVSVTSRGGRSKDVTFEMPEEEGVYQVDVTSTGMSLCLAIMPLFYPLGFIPGMLFQITGRRVVEANVPAQPSPTAPAGEEAPNGLWWQADPKLAKRFQG